MSTPYPWIEDSKYLTSPVTGYLAVTAPNGLYLNSATSEVLLKNPLISSEHATLTFQNLYIQSPATTTQNHTEITNGALIASSINFSGGNTTSTATINSGSISMLNNQPATSTSQQVQITPTQVSIFTNGGAATTANWSSILAGGGATPTLSAVLTAGNDATAQSITNIQDLTLNGVGVSTITFTNNTGALNGVLNINGSAYPPPAGTPNLAGVLGAGNTTGGLNIDFMNTANITNVLDITLSTINGGAYPPFPVAPYGLAGVLNISNDAVGASMTGLNNIDLVNINGSAYPPSGSTPNINQVLSSGDDAFGASIQGLNGITTGNINTSTINGATFVNGKNIYCFPTFNAGSIASGGKVAGGTSLSVIGGNYQITYSITFDSNFTQGTSTFYQVSGYCYLSGLTSDVYPTLYSGNIFASQIISYDGTYNTTITMTDTIALFTDTYQLGVSQTNNNSMNAGNLYVSAILTQQ